MSNNYKFEFKKHLEEKLKQINGEYSYRVNWFIDIEKAKTREDEKIDVGKNELFIVLSPLPSRSYGDSSIVQQIEITCMCAQKDMEAAIDILSEYQDSVVNKKWWTDNGTLVNESWFSPTIQENFVNFKINKGAIISMQGTATFTDDVVDIEKVLLFGQWNKMFEFVESAAGDTIPNESVDNPRKKGINRGLLYKVDLKCKSSSTIFCNTCREWKKTSGKANDTSLNVEVPMKLVYTDGTTQEYKMVINSVVFMTTDGTIPTWSVSLMEKMDVEE